MVKNLPANTGDIRDAGLVPRSERSPGEGHGKPTPVFLPGKSHRQRSLEGYGLYGCEELDMTDAT